MVELVWRKELIVQALNFKKKKILGVIWLTVTFQHETIHVFDPLNNDAKISLLKALCIFINLIWYDVFSQIIFNFR